VSALPAALEDGALPRLVTSPLRRELEKRLERGGLRLGAACVGGAGFARFERRTVLVAVPWGAGFGAWGTSLRTSTGRSGRWRPAPVWLDSEGLNLSWLGGQPHLDRVRCWRQTRLPFPEDPLACAWNERISALSSALEPVPPWALRQIGRLRPSQQWSLLGFLNRGGAAAGELAESNLALAHLVATRVRPEQTSAVLARRQRDVLELLDLPATRSSVRVLRRVVDREIDVPLLDIAMRWLGDPRGRRYLAHASRIGAALRLLPEPGGPGWLAPAAVHDTLALTDPDSLARLSECRFLVAELAQLGFEPPGRLHSLADLEGWLARLRRRHQQAGLSGASEPLPEPPFPGIPGRIEPIRSGQELLDEGTEMAHCVFDYYRDGMAGRIAFYRVLAPERCTLSLVRRKQGWQLQMLKRRANREPSFEGWGEVVRWLRGQTRRRRRRRRDDRQLALDGFGAG
jgi:hypothetical protein